VIEPGQRLNQAPGRCARRSGAPLILLEEADILPFLQQPTGRQCSKSVCWHLE
jgi:hypothetical protein